MAAASEHTPEGNLSEAIAIIGLGLTPILAVIVPSNGPLHSAHSIVALAQVLFAPGYAATYLLPLGPRVTLLAIERAGIGVALSIAIAVILGLAVNFTVGLRAEAFPLAHGVLTFVLSVWAAVVARRDYTRRHPPGCVSERPSPKEKGKPGSSKLLLTGSAAALVLMAIVLGTAVVQTSSLPTGALMFYIKSVSEAPLEACSNQITNCNTGCECFAITIGIENAHPRSQYQLETIYGSSRGITKITTDEAGTWSGEVNVTTTGDGFVHFSLYNGETDLEPLRRLRVAPGRQ
ncbi:MAG: DUF1616 domain-containing protein [Chloroflexota bacterium]